MKSSNIDQENQLEEKNANIEILQEEITSLENEVRTREYLCANLQTKTIDLEKVLNDKQMKVCVGFSCISSH